MVSGRGYKRSSGKGSLVVMFAALTLLCVYLANVLPALRITFYFISSIFMMGIMMERMTVMAFVTFAVVLFLGFLIVPVKLGMLPYLFFFGHYGIFKFYVDGNQQGAGATIMKLIYFNVCAALMYFFTDGWMIAQIPFNIPWWGLVIAGELIFLLYDWLFSKASQWYYGALRARLVGSSRF
ncbi:MAG: hypothetical protein VB081_02325 [Christensenella sp.]|uniref:hypothetical protein n=1 Tax=Christensenella sp. TaxID=1935934 RepID=UPI002B221748|nr:hypothetical protein [Christensenella sp.]MEA5002315.1 hypothetical protein [Christensenella sp.]